ncbi:MAG: sulfatase [Deltaproteobacteria bacterium]|nr:MAG: sulfatase [Deltaproteobacteria bacterium]
MRPARSARARGRRLGLLASIAAALSACGAEAPASRNLLLVSVDTLRADRLGAWGYERPSSPNLDALARESVVFEDARAPSSWTLPSLASLMTGFEVSTHRCWNFASRLDGSFTTLAEILGEAGFDTAWIGSHTFLAEKYGLQQGFADYDAELIDPVTIESHEAITSPRITDKAIAWLDGRAGVADRWFLWAHYFDPHERYLEHEGVSERFGTETKSDLYVGEIAFTDAAIGRLLDHLRESGLSPETLVVFTADHGEEFGEHGLTGHGFHLYREVVHVPLALRAAGFPARRVETLVGLVDVLPTVLELLGVPAPDGLAGRSLVPAMRGQHLPPRPVLQELRLFADVDSIEADGWKLVRRRKAGVLRLFDRSQDPGERRNLASARPEVRERLEALLDAAQEAAVARGRTFDEPEPVTLSAEEEQALRNLGYLDAPP